jgi:hypothetical protein
MSELEKILNKHNITEKELNKILKDTKKPEPLQYNEYKLPYNEKHVKFTVISDTHMGHNKYTPDILTHAIKNSKRQHSEFFLHCGDIVEGMSGREGHIYELTHIGASKQMDYAVDQLSQIDIPIYAITATNSHDGWFSSKNNMGFEVAPELERRIKNFKFVGYDEADIILDNGLKIKMTHPGDGTAYAFCFDEKTEIFSSSGWKKFKNLKFDEMVLTLNKNTLQTEWQTPTSWINEYYSGKMIHFKSKTHDCMVTPNHRMFVKRPWFNSWKFVEAKEIKKRGWKVLRTIPNWEGFSPKNIKLELPKLNKRARLQNYVNSIPIRLFVQLLGWYISEGNIGHKNKCVEISQSRTKNAKKYEEIVNLIKNIGFNVYCSENKIKITSIQAYNYFKTFGKSHEKYIPYIFKQLEKKHLLLLLDSLFKGDGCFLNGKLQNYTTNSKQLADDVQEIALKCGLGCCIKKYSERKTNFNMIRPIYQLSISHKQVTPEIVKKPTIIDYKGTIHCVSVPNKTILTRRNGKVIWTGNSYKMQKYINALPGGEKPNILLQGHYHKAEYLFYRNIHGFDAGALQKQTIFMKKKQTPSMTGYWIIDAYTNKKGSLSRIKPEFVPFYD